MDFQEVVPYYLFSIADSGLLLEANATLLKELDYTLEEIKLKKFDEILTLGSRIFYQTHFYPLIKLHSSFEEIYLTLQSKTKKEVPVLLNASMQKQGEGFTIYCVGIRISQRVQFEKELREARRAAEDATHQNENLIKLKEELETAQTELDRRMHMLERKNADLSEMNYILSHDLQEPLRKIAMFIDRFEKDTVHLLHKSNLLYLQKITKASQRMRNLLLNLQTYSELIERDLEISEVNLNQLLHNLQLSYSYALQQVSATVNSAHIPPIRGDERLITVLFKNLFDNSIKYKDPKRPLIINIQHTIIEENIYKHLKNQYRYESYIRLTFTDNGIGMNNAYSTNIFSLFRKLDHEIESSMGVGLAIGKKIVELHHGQIKADSQLGKGTSMIITLPLKQQDLAK